MSLSTFTIILFISGVVLYGWVKRADTFSAFVAGAKSGIYTCARILPYVAAMMVALSMMRASGLLAFVVNIITPAAKLIGLPPEVLPLVVIRPFSGSAALAVLADILTAHGADGEIGRAACIIMGSSETLFYTATVYYGSIGVTKWRHTIPVGLIACLVGLVMAIILA